MHDLAIVKHALPAAAWPVVVADDDSCYAHSVVNTILNARDFHKCTLKRHNRSPGCTTPARILLKVSQTRTRWGGGKAKTAFGPGHSEISALWVGQSSDAHYFHGIARPRDRSSFIRGNFGMIHEGGHFPSAGVHDHARDVNILDDGRGIDSSETPSICRILTAGMPPTTSRPSAQEVASNTVTWSPADCCDKAMRHGCSGERHANQHLHLNLNDATLDNMRSLDNTVANSVRSTNQKPMQILTKGTHTVSTCDPELLSVDLADICDLLTFGGVDS